MADSATIDRRIVDFIASHHVLTLGTSYNDECWCAQCFYVFLEEHACFFFASDPQTRHMTDLCHNGAASISILLETKEVGRLQGLQAQGIVTSVNPQLLDQARKAYLKRFPVARIMELTLWQFNLTYLKFTDNRLGFGKKLEWSKHSDFSQLLERLNDLDALANRS